MIEPSLQLNFAKTRQLDRRITFARADTADSQASYYDYDGLLKFARKGEPRFTHDPSTGDSLGLLIEESRTNLLTYSNAFSTSPWVLAPLATLTPSVGTALDGTNTAWNIEKANYYRNVSQVVSLPSGNGTFTASAYFKGSTGTIALYENNTSVSLAVGIFNLTAGTSYDYAGSGAAMTYVRDGWWRCYVTGTTTTNTNITQLIYPGTHYSSAIENVDFWGAQLEAGSSPTSYIPTTSAAVTRAAESAVMTGTNFSDWYNQTDGTFVAIGRTNRTSDTLGYLYWSKKTGTAGRGTAALIDTSGQYVKFYVRDDSGTGLQSVASIADGAAVNSALGYSSAASIGAVNGTFTGGASTSPYAGIDALEIGSGEISIGSPGTLNGTISRLTYFPKRLSNAELQALSSL